MYKVISPKTVYWFKTLSKFVSVQLVVQALGFASGILLIRILDKQEYAYFTLANSMQGTMNVLADSGISSGLSSIGGKIWQDPYRFGQLINTAMEIRRYLAAIAVTIVTPILIWMLLKNGASFTYAIFLVVGILIELYFYISDGVMRIVPRLYSQLNRLQNLDLIVAGSRLILLIGFSLTVLNAAIGIFASTIASGLKNKFLWNSVKNTIKIDVPINQEDKKEMFNFIRMQAPNSIFYCLQGQITIWLITLFGSTENIANLGAITRLGVIFSLASSIITNIVLPSFTRCQSPNLLTRRYFQVIFIYLLFGIFLISLGLIFPTQLLWILGEQYRNLHDELILVLLNGIFSSAYIFVYCCNFSKGWIESTWTLIPAIILTQIISLYFVDISTLKGVICFGLFPFLPMYLINFYITYTNILRLKNN
ncbi:unknown protein [Stanieria sp. NIES-3757]|nr:unknown protein [Stanieria sp. NIES-3757]